MTAWWRWKGEVTEDASNMSTAQETYYTKRVTETKEGVDERTVVVLKKNKAEYEGRTVRRSSKEEQ